MPTLPDINQFTSVEYFWVKFTPNVANALLKTKFITPSHSPLTSFKAAFIKMPSDLSSLFYIVP